MGMADQLYLSLWYPNFRLASLPAAVAGVLHQFARIAAEGKPSSPLTRVAAATVYPIDWTESPTWQRIYVNDPRSQESDDSTIDAAVAEATEQLHDDCAYEFEMRWMLWMPEHAQDEAGSTPSDERSGEDDEPLEEDFAATGHHDDTAVAAAASAGWTLRPARVRVTGFGPDFDAGAYDTNGHIRVDFGLDTPWTFEDQLPGSDAEGIARKHIQSNVEKLLAFTLLVEKNGGISSRLLWTESGEPLAEKLVAQLQRVN